VDLLCNGGGLNTALCNFCPVICVVDFFVVENSAELYLSSGKFDSAYACIQEAGSINPVSHVVSYMVG
jgi:hypothetical protein